MKPFISVIMLLASAHSFAQAVATVLFTTPNVIAEQAGVKRTLTRGASLSDSNTIITTTNASAKIKYTNGTIVSIGSESNYKILSYAPKQDDVALTAELTKGRIESDTNGAAKRESLKTPMVELAISGTKYQVYVDADKKTYVKLIEGEVRLCKKRPLISRKPQKCYKTLKPGESVSVSSSGVSAESFPAEGNIPPTSDISSPSIVALTNGAGPVNFINTTMEVSQQLSSSAAITDSLIATFSVICIP